MFKLFLKLARAFETFQTSLEFHNKLHETSIKLHKPEFTMKVT